MGGVVIAEPTVLSLEGELCIAELPDVRALIETAITAGATVLVLDLAAVTLVTAAAVRVLATTEARLAASGGELRLRNVPPMARRVLEITGFDHLVEPPVPA